MGGGGVLPDGHILRTSQRNTTTPTMYAIVRYCRIVEFAAMEREWWREVEKRLLANEPKVLPYGGEVSAVC